MLVSKETGRNRGLMKLVVFSKGGESHHTSAMHNIIASEPSGVECACTCALRVVGITSITVCADGKLRKTRETRAAYPIPIYSFLMPHCPVTVVQRYRDGVCSLLFPSLFHSIVFHKLPSLYLPLVLAVLQLQSLGASPQKKIIVVDIG